MHDGVSSAPMVSADAHPRRARRRESDVVHLGGRRDWRDGIEVGVTIILLAVGLVGIGVPRAVWGSIGVVVTPTLYQYRLLGRQTDDLMLRVGATTILFLAEWSLLGLLEATLGWDLSGASAVITDAGFIYLGSHAVTYAVNWKYRATRRNG